MVEFISAILLLAFFRSMSFLSPCSFVTAFFLLNFPSIPFAFLFNAIFLEKRYFGDDGLHIYLLQPVLKCAESLSQDCMAAAARLLCPWISQARTLDRAALSSSRGSSKMGVLAANWLSVSWYLGKNSFTCWIFLLLLEFLVTGLFFLSASLGCFPNSLFVPFFLVGSPPLTSLQGLVLGKLFPFSSFKTFLCFWFPTVFMSPGLKYWPIIDWMPTCKRP